ncbi:hypothetical protein ACH5RR_023914 [Cinchona calisaya]|uniref:Uncharacterized protein n=1 Tax=Cinchona calisaya TaxID=153742 RepID=A0ABD2ZF44_9GENT
MEKGRECVTGGSGMFASWLIKSLLEDGNSVNATIRSSSDSFDAVIQGCTGVFHVAYLIDLEGKEAEETKIKRAVNGTVGMLQAAIAYAEKHGLDFVSIIPTWIHGSFVCPFLPGSVSASMAMIIDVVKYLWRTPFVHTDDLARAHIFLFEYPKVKGRYICNAVEITIDKLVS